MKKQLFLLGVLLSFSGLVSAKKIVFDAEYEHLRKDFNDKYTIMISGVRAGRTTYSKLIKLGESVDFDGSNTISVHNKKKDNVIDLMFTVNLDNFPGDSFELAKGYKEDDDAGRDSIHILSGKGSDNVNFVMNIPFWHDLE